MEYRIGTCLSCGAEYKIPASFAHDAARCKQCNGTVQIAPAKASGAPEPRSVAPAGQARKPEPTPSGKPVETPPRKKGSTLERLKAERHAEREAAARRTAPTPAPTPAQPKRPAARRGSPAASKGSTATPAARARGRTAGRSRSPSPGRSRAARKQKLSPVGLLAILILVGAGAAAWLFRDKLFGAGAPAASDTVASAADEPAGGPPAAEPPAATSPAAPVTPGEGAGAGASGELPPETPATEPPTGDQPDPFAEAPEAASADPGAIDLLALPDFGPAKGCTQAEWDQMEAWLDTWMDPDAGVKGNRAKASLVGQSFKAIPVVLNRLKSMDLSSEAGQENGSQCQAALREICGGLNFNWKDGTTPEDELFNKKVVKAWAGLWDEASTDVDALIKILKLDPESAEANAVRETYGVEPVETDADAAGEGDDFEID